MQQRQSAALVSGNFGTLQRQLCCMQRHFCNCLRQSGCVTCGTVTKVPQACGTAGSWLRKSCGATRHATRHSELHQLNLHSVNHPISTVEPIKPQFNRGSTFLNSTSTTGCSSTTHAESSPSRKISITFSPNWFNPVTKPLATEAPSFSPSPVFSCTNYTQLSAQLFAELRRRLRLVFLGTCTQLSADDRGTQSQYKGKLVVLILHQETLKMSHQAEEASEVRDFLENRESTLAPFFLPFNDRQLFNVFCETAQFETSKVEVHIYNNFIKSCFNQSSGSLNAVSTVQSRLFEALRQCVVARGNHRLALNGSEHRSGVCLHFEQRTKGTGGHLPVQRRSSCGNVEQSRSEAAATADVTLRQCDKQRQSPAAMLAAAAAICST
ncbi:hypothetical protein B0H16DRAFT_1477810 [Mycena metata]|uniref:Uncharacterized protein n=1 Tax=Mycena metata TaxID=1033252 RepID=A0AAD7H8T3_9AGAR|nr:hypothetical protein B0H16DRAFT_1477810 [Mycena metata]